MDKLENLFNVIEASDFLKCSVQTVYKAVMVGDLKAEKHFSRNFFSRSELERYMDQKQMKNGKRRKVKAVDI